MKFKCWATFLFSYFLLPIIGSSFQAYSSQKKNKNSSMITFQNARFTVISPYLIRMEYSPDFKFIDSPSLFAIHRDARFKGAKINQSKEVLSIDTGRIRLTYKPNGRSFEASNLMAEIQHNEHWVSWKAGDKNLNNLGGTIRTLDQVKGPIPLGEGILSKDGWYVLDDTNGHLLKDNWVQSRTSSQNSSEKDWYLFGYGTSFKEALHSFTKIAGKVPLPRKYVFGSWYSRYWPYSSSDYRNIVKEYEDHDFPLDVMVMDMDWHLDGWTGYTWNRSLLPDAENLVKWFHEKKLAVTLNDHPADGIAPHEEMYAEFMREMGENPNSSKTIPYDAGSKKYLDAMFKTAHGAREKDGIDFWWLDWQQYQYTRSIPDLSNLTWLNHYYFYQSQKNNQRGLSFSRWGGWGDHRNPIHFSGDAHTDFKMLEFQVPMTATAGNVGCFYWSHDIGGHMGNRNEESYLRWVQFGATSASLRIHSTRSPSMDRRPWTYSPEAEASMRRAFHLRSEIFPYVYTAAWKSYKENIPFNRPMYIEYPNESDAYLYPNQYFLGDDFLVAPVVTPGIGAGKVAVQKVWFPKGEWIHFFTGEKFVGPQSILVSSDLNEFPIFVRAGKMIPMQKYQDRMAESLSDPLVLRVFYTQNYNQPETSLFYEDDGKSRDYLKGGFATTQFEYTQLSAHSAQVVVYPSEGKFSGQPINRKLKIQFAGTSEKSDVFINGKKAIGKFISELHLTEVEVEGLGVHSKIEVKIISEPANQAAIQNEHFERRLKGIVGNHFQQGKPLVHYIKDYSNRFAQESTVQALLALGNIGASVRSSGVYLYPEQKDLLQIFTGSSQLAQTNIHYSVLDYACGQVLSVAEGVCSQGFVPCNISLPLQSEQFGCQRKRIAKFTTQINGEYIVWDQLIDHIPSYTNQWNIVGPFPFDPSKGISQVNVGPEKWGADLSKSYPDGAFGEVKWKQAEIDSEGIVDLWAQYSYENKVAYGVTYLKSDVSQQITLKINSDDQVEVFLDGQKIHSKEVWRPIAHEPDIVKVNLSAGSHTLMIKVANGGGYWAYRVAIEASQLLKQSATPF